MSTKLVLYSTWGCHLCEQAEALLQAQSYEYQCIDIVDEPDAFAKYRVHIPVVSVENVANKQQVAELFWPFDGQMLADFLTEHVRHLAINSSSPNVQKDD